MEKFKTKPAYYETIHIAISDIRGNGPEIVKGMRIQKRQTALALCLFLLTDPCFGQIKKEGNPDTALRQTKETAPLISEKAVKRLKAVLKKYRRSHVHLRVKKKFRIPIINKVSTETGNLYIQRGGLFRYSMRSSSAEQLMIFDGEHLWHQPDTGEKTVFRLPSHPQWRLFSGLFDPDRFFEVFTVEKTERKGSSHTFHLKPKNLTGVQGIKLTVNRYIKEVEILWSGMETWQKYEFSNPWFKAKISKSLFVFKTEGFEIVDFPQE